MYDVIVVGARVAGSATAMLLARKGIRVLVVDRAGFPSDTLSTHQVQLPGVARLRDWGLLEKLVDAGTPPARHVMFDVGPVVLDGHYPEFRGVDAVYSPRRALLDSTLVGAARAAGAEVREHVTVDEIVIDAGRVTGVRCRERSGHVITETAPLVIGADGKHSIVARAVDATIEVNRPVQSLMYYTYWENVAVSGGELYSRDRRAVGAWPTNDGLLMTAVMWPAAEFGDFRADIEGNLLRTLDQAGDLGERVRNGRRAERIFGAADVPNSIRRSHGPGWALAGDAGLVMDPFTGQGIGNAFRDADVLAGAVEDGLGGRTPLADALASYQERRDRETRPMFDFTVDIASFAPPRPEQRALFDSLARGRQADVDRFFGVMTGAVAMTEFFGPGNLLRLMGVRGMTRLILGRMRAPSPAGASRRTAA
jgi:flavin-dependent dehydrogenase